MTKDELLKLAAEHRLEVTAPAAEILRHIYAAMLAIPPVTLASGVTAKIEPYFSPSVDDDSTASCGIDVVLSDGTELEFTLANTGWGKSLAGNPAKPSRARSRSR